ncbi:MAG: 5'/3'-nucleotidase SurE [Deltaproteobacteria bacterium]|nr:5'/3'-nucleotidase SurE [Deltaproteobacteria bacterium]
MKQSLCRHLLGCAVTTALVVSAMLGTVVTTSADGKQSGPLRILLTNDDGWNAVGITAVYDALVAAGYDVTVVAPLTNQSGVGGRITFGGPPLQVVLQALRKYSVAGSPADAVEVGLSVVFANKPPDLVISGTNVGQNVGAATVHSGTVGAAVTALNDGVPAIAVSTEIDFATNVGPFAETSAFVVKLVAALRKQTQGSQLLPEAVGLNVNYPLLEGGGAPTDVVLTQNGRGFLDLTYTGALPTTVGESSALTIGLNLAVPESEEHADTAALAANMVSISTLEPDYDAASDVHESIRKIVEELKD